MKKYKKGSIIEFPETPLGELLVVDTYIENNSQYLLVVPYSSTEETVDIALDKLVLLEIQADNSAKVITDKKIVSKVVKQLLNK